MNFAISGFKDAIDMNRVVEMSNSLMTKMNTKEYRNGIDYITTRYGDREYKIKYEETRDIMMIIRNK
jgi:hypothetical protein